MPVPQSKRFRKMKPSVRDGALALRDHVVAVATTAREKYGPTIDLEAIYRILEDRTLVRYPVRVEFDDAALEPGEFAYPKPLGNPATAGFALYLHPQFERATRVLPLLIAYQLVRVNYGDLATSDEAELFGAALLGMTPGDYYNAVCAAADSILSAAKV